MPHIGVNGQSIFYTDTGGDGPVVIATHATLMDTVSLEPLTREVAAADHRVVAFDLRGHGRTVYDEQAYALEEMAHDVLALADHLALQNFTFLGEGQGAIVAMRTALLAPERVEALVLVGATACAADEAENGALASAMDIWCSQGPNPAAYEIVAQYATGSPEDAAALFDRWQRSAWRQYRPAADALANRVDFVELLPTIECPALLIHGTDDFFVPLQLGRTVAQNLGGPVEFVEVPGERQTITIAFDPRVAEHTVKWLLGQRHSE